MDTTLARPLRTADGYLVNPRTGEVLESPGTPAPAPAPDAPAPTPGVDPGPSGPITPTQPAQEPEQDPDQAAAVPGPVADVDRQLAKDREAGERAVERENAPPGKGKRASRYHVTYAIVEDAEDDRPPLAWSVWDGSVAEPDDGEPVVVAAHTQPAAREQMLEQDERARELALEGRLWLACIPVASWTPRRPTVVAAAPRLRA